MTAFYLILDRNNAPRSCRQGMFPVLGLIKEISHSQPLERCIKLIIDKFYKFVVIYRISVSYKARITRRAI